MKIVTVLGARPQFIKAATLSRALKEHPSIREVIVHTGQHYDSNMSDVFFDEMNIPRPDHFLQISSPRHGEMTGKMLEGIEKILFDERPDMVLVYGDTNSTLAGALAASKLHIPIGHVEAGLRSFNRRMPEEINRVVTDHLSQWLFCPTESGVANLVNEGIKKRHIFHVGDIMYDTMLHYQKVVNGQLGILERLGLVPNEFVLVTIHRAENTNDLSRLNDILNELNEIGKQTRVVFPIHPRTRNIVKKNDLINNITVIEPLGYLDMIALQKHCRLIVTDSGGVQKEAFFNKKYCITVREETEWIELVENGFNFLANPISMTSDLVKKLWSESFADKGYNPYGDGDTAEQIVKILKNEI